MSFSFLLREDERLPVGLSPKCIIWESTPRGGSVVLQAPFARQAHTSDWGDLGDFFKACGQPLSLRDGVFHRFRRRNLWQRRN